MTTDKKDEQVYRIVVPEKTTMNFLRMAFPDGYVSIMLLMVSMTVGFIYGWLFLFIAFGVSLGVMRRFEHGRAYYLFGLSIRNLMISHRKGYLWQSKAHRSSRTPHQSMKAPKRRLIVSQRIIPLEPLELGEIGIIHDHYSGSDSIVIEVEGGEVPSSDFVATHNFVLGLAEGVKRLVGQQDGYSIGVSYLFRRRPVNHPRTSQMIGRNFHPDVVLPLVLAEQTPIEQWKVEDHRAVAHHTILMESFAAAEEYGGEVVMAFVITISRDGDLRGAANGRSIAASEVNRMPVARIASSMIRELNRLNVRGARVLNSFEIQRFLRRAWDVADIDQYDHDVELHLDDPACPMPKFWPDFRIRARRRGRYLITDNTVHAVYKIRACPPESGAPNFFGRLHHEIRSPWRSVVFASDVVTSSFEYRVNNKVIPISRAARDAMGVDYEDPKARKRREGLEERQENIFRSAFNQDGVPLVVVSAPLGPSGNPYRELEEYLNDAKAVLEPIGLRPVMISNPSLILGAVMTGTTGVPML